MFFKAEVKSNLGKIVIEFDKEDLSIQNPVAKIKVVGIGGAGGNTVNHMINSKYENVDFVVVNTDVQALRSSQALTKIQIGSKITKGLGAGANPEIGKISAEEDLDKIAEQFKDANLIFFSAGLGGGTGSGAAPVIAKMAKDMGILCVAVVTKPFLFEGRKRMSIAENALSKLKNNVDTLIVVPNQKLLDITDVHISLMEAFGMVNEVMHQFVRGVADIILNPGHINVDFADVRTIMKDMGSAVMGTGVASGADRAEKAAMQAISSPLLENADIYNAKAVLLNITGNSKLGLHEVHSAASIIYQTAQDAEIIMGSVVDESMDEEVSVTIIATGIDNATKEKRADSFANQISGAVKDRFSKIEEEKFSNKEFEKVELKEKEEDIEKQKEMENSINSAVEDLGDIHLDDIEIPTLLRNLKRESSKKDSSN